MWFHVVVLILFVSCSLRFSFSSQCLVCMLYRHRTKERLRQAKNTNEETQPTLLFLRAPPRRRLLLLLRLVIDVQPECACVRLKEREKEKKGTRKSSRCFLCVLCAERVYFGLSLSSIDSCALVHVIILDKLAAHIFFTIQVLTFCFVQVECQSLLPAQQDQE